MRIEEDAILDVRGFCSVYIDKQIAVDTVLMEDDEIDDESIMMLIDKEGPLQNVLYEINFTDVWAHFEMSGDIYSSFPEEQELVL